MCRSIRDFGTIATIGHGTLSATIGVILSLFEEEGFVVEKVRVWGFPLGRLYHRLFFAPWLLRTRGQAVEEREGRADTRVGRHRWVVESVVGYCGLMSSSRVGLGNGALSW